MGVDAVAICGQQALGQLHSGRLQVLMGGRDLKEKFVNEYPMQGLDSGIFGFTKVFSQRT